MPETITRKRPMVKQTVGDMYYAFNTMTQQGEYNPGAYENTIGCSTVKSVDTTENAESTVVRASGQDYMTVSQESSIDMAVETVAFDAGDLARMKGEDTSDQGGLVLGGAPRQRPFFAFGKVVKKANGEVRYEWFPKCQLVENTDNIATSEESYNEQNDTVTIRAFSFDSNDNKKAYVDSEMSSFPEGLTEEQFFTKPILTAEDLAEAAGGSI